MPRPGLLYRITMALLSTALGIGGLKCYTCDNEISNHLCNTELSLMDCDTEMDTCQTLVGYSDVSEKLSIIKACTKNQSCLQQARETRVTPCHQSGSSWICTHCCYSDACNINHGNTVAGLPFCIVSMVTVSVLPKAVLV